MNKEELKKWRESGRDFLAADMIPMPPADEGGPATADDERRTVDVCWYTGIDVPRIDWWTGDQYMLRLPPDGADLSVLNSGAPVLDHHMTYDGASESQKGKVEKAWVADSGNYLATLRFSRRPECDGLWTDIRDGIVTKFSMGVELLETVEQRDAAGKLIMKTATKWRPFEISTEPIPADFGTATLSAEPATDVSRATAQNHKEEVPKMPEQTTTTGTEARTEVDATALRAEGARLERERLTAIDAAAAPFLKRKEIDNALVEQFKRDGNTVEQFKAAVWDKLAERSDENPLKTHHPAGTMETDERDKRREGMSAVLLNRLSPSKYKLEAGNEFRGMSLLEMARECLDRAGIRTRGAAPMDLATRALETSFATTLIGTDGIERLGMMSTSDFPYILANTANKYMLGAYAEYPAQWRQLAFQRNARDFKTQYPTLVSAAEVFELQGENGEYKYGKLTESRESYAVKTYGKAYLFGRQMLINDDLAVFQDMAAAQGRAAARTESNLFWKLITDNPTMADTNAVFIAAHNNLVDPGTAINVDNLGIARKTLRRQTGLASEKLELTPKFLVVPVGKEQLALQYTAYLTATNDSSKVNPWQGTLTVIPEPRLDDASLTAWYIAASPAEHPSIVFAYLDGQEGVYQESRLGFNPEGLEFKARIDFAVAWTSHRGWVKNLGA